MGAVYRRGRAVPAAVCVAAAPLAVCAATLLETSFDVLDGWAPHDFGDWLQATADGVYTGRSINVKSTAPEPRSGEHRVGFNDVDDALELPPVTNAGVLSFYTRLSSPGSSTANKLQVQKYAGGTWQDVGGELLNGSTNDALHVVPVNDPATNVRLRILRTADERTHGLDDLRLTIGPGGVTNAADSNIDAIGVGQPPAATLDSVTNTSAAAAVSVLAFRVVDSGDGDAEPTIVTTLTVRQGPADTGGDWFHSLGGAELRTAAGPLSVGVTNIGSNAVVFHEIAGLVVADGTTTAVTMRVWLRDSGGQLGDGAALQFVVASADHMCIADAGGSTFSNQLVGATGELFTVGVTATAVAFDNPPTSVETAAPFAVSLHAADAHGNVDRDIGPSRMATVTLVEGAGVLDNGEAVAFTNGVATFPALRYDRAEAFSIVGAATTGTPTLAASGPLWLTAIATLGQLNPDAACDELSQWSVNGGVAGTNDLPGDARTGARSLSFFNGTVSGKSLMTPLIGLVEGTNYVVQYYYRGGTTNSSMRPGIRRPTVYDYGAVRPGAPSWTKAVHTAVATATATNGMGLIQVRETAAADLFFVDDVCVYAGPVDTNAPLGPASLVAAPRVGRIDLSWPAAQGGVDGGGYLVVRRVGSAVVGIPNSNGVYAVGDSVATSERVVYTGAAPAFTDTEVADEFVYHYRVWTYDKAHNHSLAAPGAVTRPVPKGLVLRLY